MIERLLRVSLEQRGVVLLFTLVFVGWGLFAFSRLPVEAFPDVTDPQVSVITLFPGRAAEEVERQVTIPIERELNGLPGLARLRSQTLFGLSSIVVTFDEGVDDYFARQQVAERLRTVELPEGVEARLGELYTPVGEIYRYTLEGGGRTPMELRTIQEWVVEKALRQVPGVVEVVSYGGSLQEFHVDVDLARLRAVDVTLADVEQAIARASHNTGGGYLERGAQELVVRGIGALQGVEDLRRVVVAARDGTPVLLRDVAHVEVGEVPRRGAVARDDDPDAVQGIVLMRKHANPSQVLDGVRARVDELNQRILPRGVHLRVFHDRTELVDRTLHTVAENLALGALLVALVLGLFLVDWRGVAIVVTVIPLALLAAFVYLDGRRMSANLLSMGAVDFGIIVDAAVVILDAIFARLAGEQPGTARDRADAVRRAVVEVARPTVLSALIIMVAYLPVFALEHVEGRIFAPMANTVLAALVGALVFSITLVPLLAAMALVRPVRAREAPAVSLARRLHRPALGWLLSRPVGTLTVAGAALAGALALAPRLGSEFLPELDEGALYVHVTLPLGISLTEGQRFVPRVIRLVRESPEVKQVLTQLGRPEDGTDTDLSNNLELFVDLQPRARWRRGLTRERLVAEMSARLAALPGIEFGFSQPIKENVEENISGVFGQLSVKVFGDDLVTLERKAREVERVLSTVPGAVDLSVYQGGDIPQLQIRVDRDAAARHGINIADAQAVVETAIGGRVVTDIWEGERRFGVRVRLGEAQRDRPETIRAIPVPTPAGARIPLGQIADVRLGSGRAAIGREANSRFLAVKLNVRGRDLGGFVEEARRRVAAEVELPEGYRTVWSGEFENHERAMKRLGIVIPLAVLFTFLLLVWTFRSLRSALLILVDVPFALVGGVVALWLTGQHLSVSAAVGFITVMGQAVLDGVLLVSAIERVRADGEVDMRQACLQGTATRLRAVLMTALLATLGLLPAALSTAIGSETQRPLATVVVGGLITATTFTLLVLPVLYAYIMRRAPTPHVAR